MVGAHLLFAELHWFYLLNIFLNVLFCQQQIPMVSVNALSTKKKKKRPEKHEVSVHLGAFCKS